jgi:hypothetical protein
MSMPEPTLALLECFWASDGLLRTTAQSPCVVSIVLQELPGNDYAEWILFTLLWTSRRSTGVSRPWCFDESLGMPRGAAAAWRREEAKSVIGAAGAKITRKQLP